MLELEQHLSPQEIAQRLSVSLRQVRRWIADGVKTRGKAGLWPVRKLGRRVVRVPVSAVERFFEGAS